MKNIDKHSIMPMAYRSAAIRVALWGCFALFLEAGIPASAFAAEEAKPPQVVTSGHEKHDLSSAAHDDGLSHDALIDTTEDDGDRQLISKAIETAKPAQQKQTKEDVHQAQEKPKGSLEQEMSKHAEELSKPDKPEPLKIRLAGMPSRYSPPPLPTAVIRPKPEKAQAVAEKKEEIQPQVSKEALEALTAIRKRELAAIEKDKATLAALQAAIKDLGVSDKISFAKEKGSLIGKETSSVAGASGTGASPAKETPKL